MLLKSGREVKMLSIIFFILAAICNSICDTLVHHFGISVFCKLNAKWWWPDISWKNKYIGGDPGNPERKLFGVFSWPFSDGWHTFKSLMIVFICLSIVTFKSPFHFDFIPYWLELILDFLSYGLWWNATFNIFYNKILIKK